MPYFEAKWQVLSRPWTPHKSATSRPFLLEIFPWDRLDAPSPEIPKPNLTANISAGEPPNPQAFTALASDRQDFLSIRLCGPSQLQ